jgi:hypothetical protein
LSFVAQLLAAILSVSARTSSPLRGRISKTDPKKYQAIRDEQDWNAKSSADAAPANRANQISRIKQSLHQPVGEISVTPTVTVRGN